MKKTFYLIFFCLFLTILLPFFTIHILPKKEVKKAEPFLTISVLIKEENRVVQMDCAQYLKEVVAAEMPAEFHEEALKAQAVAARTYLTNRVNNARKNTPPPEHNGADICTDSTHCKAWISEEKRRTLWPSDKQEAYWKKVSDAVLKTTGVLITYENQPISAVFHSTSSGFTENAKDVWGGDIPYLVSVESKGEELSPRFRSERILSVAEFKQIAEEKLSGIDWSQELISDIVKSNSGGIITLKVGGVAMKGSEFRSLYELRSTNIAPTIVNETVTLSVTGFGHGVGMSQYGANYLASQGMQYADILQHYYTGVHINNGDAKN